MCPGLPWRVLDLLGNGETDGYALRGMSWRIFVGAPSRSAPTNRLIGENMMQHQKCKISHAISALYQASACAVLSAPLRIFDGDDDLNNPR